MKKVAFSVGKLPYNSLFPTTNFEESPPPIESEPTKDGESLEELVREITSPFIVQTGRVSDRTSNKTSLQEVINESKKRRGIRDLSTSTTEMPIDEAFYIGSVSEKRDPFKGAPRPDPFKGTLIGEEGPLLKMVLTCRSERVVGWIDYESPALRKLLLNRGAFKASNGITIGAGDHPLIQQNTIHLLGSVEKYDKVSMGWNYSDAEDAEETLDKFLCALKEFCDVLRGIDKKEEELATKFINNNIVHVF